MKLYFIGISVSLFFVSAFQAGGMSCFQPDTLPGIGHQDTLKYPYKILKSLPEYAVDEIFVPAEQSLVINEFMALNRSVLADEQGEYDDWIEIFNFGDLPVDLNGLYITDELSDPQKWRIFSGEPGPFYIQPGEFLVFWADDQPEQGIFHLGFKLSSEEEEIAIFTSADMILIDSVSFGQQLSDISCGRQPDGNEIWNYFMVPTPGESNSSEGLLDIVSAPKFSREGGFFSDTVTLSLLNEYPDAVTHYTLDGSVPIQTSPIYTHPLRINGTTIFRARSFHPECIPGEVVTYSFLFEPAQSLNVISLVTDSTHLWGTTGIYTNRFSGLEKPVHIEYLRQDGIQGFSLDAGIEIHGPDGQAQQSFRLSARSRYGQDEILYPIFDNKGIGKYKRLILRNSGNDGLQLGSHRTHFRDPLIHTFCDQNDSRVSISSYIPVHVYLNGEYWGIYNLREKIDRFYILQNFGMENIDLLERSFGYPGNRNAIEGDWEHFDHMKHFADSANLDQPDNYSYMKDLMDVNNFAEYWIYVVFFGNFDWLSNNMKFWRPRTSNGKWQWIHWDLDHGLGLPYLDYSEPDWNTLEWSTSTEDGRPWNGTNTVLIRNLLENHEFREGFINRFADLLNSAFRPEDALPLVDSIVNLLKDDIEMQIEKWGSTIEAWNQATGEVEDYLYKRPAFVWEHIRDKFDLSQPGELTLNVMPENAGKIEVNYITINQFPWQGNYFKEVPVSIKAIPKAGFEFVGWNDLMTEDQDTVISIDSLVSLTANFIVNPGEKDILINEINYNSSGSFNTGDWIEFYNPNDWEKSISGWKFTDSDDDHEFYFPGNARIGPGNYLIVCRDSMDLLEFFPDLTKVHGNLDFGLSSNGEYIRLYDEVGKIIDSVYYLNTYPWPTEPDGSGETLELIGHNPANNIPSNWQASYILGGTPGKINSEIQTGIHNYMPGISSILVYPNPGPGSYSIVFPETIKNEYIIRVFNVLGKQVFVYRNDAGDHRKTIDIDLTNQADGVYILSIQSEENIYTARIVKSSLGNH